jgi:hypothetical protein
MPDSGSEGDLPNEDPGTIALVETLFVPTDDVETGTVITRFHTNDPKYWSPQGFTLWTMWDTGTPDGSTAWEREVIVSKKNGYKRAGYGMVLCQGVRTYKGKSEQTMLTVFINNEREFAIGKVIAGQYTIMRGWTKTLYLNTGTGVDNKLKVGYNPALAEFTLTINGNVAYNFKDMAEPRHSGGKNGYIVVIGPLDNFPTEEVDVYFTETR